MPNQYILKKAMLNDLAAQLEQHSDDCEPLTLLIMQRFIKYVEDFPAADVQLDKAIAKLREENNAMKRLLKSAADEWHVVCEWGSCGEHCVWFEGGKCAQEWSGKAEALSLIKEDHK